MSSVASRVPLPAVPQGLPPALETSTQPTLPFHSFTRVITTKTSEKKISTMEAGSSEEWAEVSTRQEQSPSL